MRQLKFNLQIREVSCLFKQEMVHVQKMELYAVGGSEVGWFS